MNGKDLLWKSGISGLTYKESEKENHVIIVSSYEKMGDRLAYIQNEFKDAAITAIKDDFGYGLFEVKLQ